MSGTQLHTQVVIVGAGLAGLACAKQLTQRGLSVLILDKARGPGGRVSSKRTEDHSVDLGAQFFTVRTPEFGAQVDQWASEGQVKEWAPRMALAAPNMYSDSPDRHTRYVGSPKMGAIGHAAAQGLTIRPRSRVIEVSDSLILESGEKVSYEQLVLACPADQTAELIDVKIPAQAPCWSAWVDIDAEQPFDAAFVKDSPIGWVANDSSKPGRESKRRWVMQATREWSQDFLEQTPEWAMREMQQALHEILPNPFEISQGAIHRWRYARPWPSDESMATSSIRFSDNIWVCGDYLNGGRVEGAWQSGYQTASHILAALEQR